MLGPVAIAVLPVLAAPLAAAPEHSAPAKIGFLLMGSSPAGLTPSSRCSGRASQALGLAIPESLRLRADEIIR
jgi:hypothetical protein